jgi:hypothetical protein
MPASYAIASAVAGYSPVIMATGMINTPPLSRL